MEPKIDVFISQKTHSGNFLRDICVLPDHPTALAEPPSIEGCHVFPADNPWNRDISKNPVDPNSSKYVASNFNASNYKPQARVILNALKKYSLILADNGGDWFITGAQDSNGRMMN